MAAREAGKRPCAVTLQLRRNTRRCRPIICVTSWIFVVLCALLGLTLLKQFAADGPDLLSSGFVLSVLFFSV